MVMAITGATGRVGGLVARHLADAGVEQRLLVKDRARAPQLPGSRAMTFLEYGDRTSSLKALQGVDVLFMVSASESADRIQQHETFVDAAAEEGVMHLVYLSFLGAAPYVTFTLARNHWATEERVRSTGMRYTFLRDSMYSTSFQNWLETTASFAGPPVTGVWARSLGRTWPAWPRPCCGIRPLTKTRPTDLTGREALTLEQVARTLTEVTGRRTTYHEETIEEAYASRAPYNAPQWQLDAWVSTYIASAKGELAEVNDTVESVTGVPPITLREFLKPR